MTPAPLTYGSVCSGIEGASVAWKPLGWRCAFMAETAAFPRAVLEHHYPDVPLHGDFTQLRDHHRDVLAEVDVLVGGTPCQGFSVAGLRGSLSDDRSNLCLEYLRLANTIDDFRQAAGRPPCWILWENVHGVFSTKDNAFGAFLGGLVGSDSAIEPRVRWTDAGVVAGPSRVAAWRVLDSQYFGLAQQRARVFVLALGGAGAWRCADALLPLADALRGHPAPSRQATEGGVFTVAARGRGDGVKLELRDDGLANAILTPSGGRAGTGIGAVAITSSSTVRRLLPVECCRLQGYPDDYLDIEFRRKRAADGHRYRALGNAFPTPVVRWIGEQIAEFN
jgi:site-specific DNA-cytosine methylase